MSHLGTLHKRPKTGLRFSRQAPAPPASNGGLHKLEIGELQRLYPLELRTPVVSRILTGRWWITRRHRLPRQIRISPVYG